MSVSSQLAALMVNKNYRGRFEGDSGNIGMVSERRQKMNFTKYNKFWVAIIGFGLQALTAVTGFDLTAFGLTPEAIISIIGAVTAGGVFAIPNYPYHKSAS